jgi:CBS domain-containing protein
MSKPVIACTPWDTAQVAARLMKKHSIGAIPVVSDIRDPLLEGIVTDRDLCIALVAKAQLSSAVEVAGVMTRIPVTCQPDNTLEECQELMRSFQVRRIPVVDQRGRCLGMISQADIALHGYGQQVAATLREISKAPKPRADLPFDEQHFFCGQLHELDQIALLQWRRRQATPEEVLT